MPYVIQEVRDILNQARVPHNHGRACTNNPGQLNYIITETILGYLDGAGINYATVNAILGVLTAIQLELYRRVVAPYERTKCVENGDVYPEPER